MPIPKTMQDKYNEIAPIIIDFCDRKLNEGYKEICLRLLEKLCRKRPSPLLSGRVNTWAGGIVYAIGQANFIFDKSQKIHMTAAELSEPFGIASSTAGNKATEIAKLCDINYFNSEWMLPELARKNPLNNIVKINGFYYIISDQDDLADPFDPAFETFNAPDPPQEKTEQRTEQKPRTHIENGQFSFFDNEDDESKE